MRRVALDTNLLVYLEGFDDAGKVVAVRDLLSRFTRPEVVIPVQVLGELHRVLVQKQRLPPSSASRICDQYGAIFGLLPTSLMAFTRASALAASHGIRIWDALIFSVAAEAACDALLTEDMFLNAPLYDVTLVNPFTTPDHPLIVG